MTLKECEEYSSLPNAVLSIGSNCGDRSDNVKNGIEWLSHQLLNSKASSIYATTDCHGSQREYLNAVIKGYTALTHKDLENKCKEYEILHGRTPEARASGDVPIDIDVVIYDGKIIRPKDAVRLFFTKGYNMI